MSEDHYSGLWPLPPEPSTTLEPSGEAKPVETLPRSVESMAAAVHAGETLIQPPATAKVVQSTLAAVHAGETLIQPPATAKVVQSSVAAVHAGETLIKPPAAEKVVQSSVAAVHAGETLIKPPAAAKVVQSNLAALHLGDTLIRPTASVPPASIPIPGRKPVPPSAVANASTGAVARPTVPKLVKIAPTKEASAPAPRSKRKLPESAVGERQRKTETARTASEPGPSDLRRSRRTATMTPPADKIPNRRLRPGEGNEVKRAVGQLNEDDKRAFRLRCGRILASPGKFARSHVETCMAAAL